MLSTGCRSFADSLPASLLGDSASPGIGILFSPVTLPDFKKAIANLKELAGISGENDIDKIIAGLADPQLASVAGPPLAKLAISNHELHKYGDQISEFLMLAGMSFGERDDAFVQTNQQRFNANSAIAERMRQQINAFIHKLHPGFTQINASKLMAATKGAGIRIVVFDLFEKELLAKQRGHYPEAHIQDLETFGNPVDLDHGNTVIDVILTLAPNATIVPVTSDQSSTNAAFEALAGRDGIDIVNISRTLLDAGGGKLDPVFAANLNRLAETRIITKALGNTGTDLDGNQTSLRSSLKLGPVDSLFAYDAALIKSWLAQPAIVSGHDTMLFAVNLAPFGDKIALTATIPGANKACMEHAFGTPSDGVFSFASDNFESGSSFGAPILAGLSALLLAEAKAHHPTMADQQLQQQVVTALKNTAKRGALRAEETGRGLPQGDDALAALGLR